MIGLDTNVLVRYFCRTMPGNLQSFSWNRRRLQSTDEPPPVRASRQSRTMAP